MHQYGHILQYLKMVEKRMQDELSNEDQRIYGILGPFISRGGKRIRPALSLLSCRAVGGDALKMVYPAALIELFHNFTLIHDDIEDGSEFRRGEPTLHIANGIGMALNSGDALYTLIWKRLLELDIEPNARIELLDLYVEAFKRVVEGQGIEISWISGGKFDVTEKDYISMINGKTSALMGLSCEAGAFIAGGSFRKELRNFGEKIGTAFQIQDDVLNLTGDFKKYQKEIGGDISEGKRTLIVVHCLLNAPGSEREKLISIIRKKTKRPQDIQTAISILMRNGSIEYSKKYAKALVADAKNSISGLPESVDKASLLALADYVISRQK